MVKLLLALIIILISACNTDIPVSPKETAFKLLALHDLLGKKPGQRSKNAKNNEVDRDKLQLFFVDLDKYDKFTGDIYVGIVVGALAQKQRELKEQISGDSAKIRAGAGVIYLKKHDGRWKINLDKTIPVKMKKNARLEKERYDAAKEAGKALL